VVFEAIGAVETAVELLAVNMPLPGMIRAVAERLEILRKQPRPLRPLALAAAANARQRIAPNGLRVVAGRDASARGPAAGGVVELCEPQPVRREPVEVWRGDLAAVATGVGVTHVIGEEDDDVGLGGWRGDGDDSGGNEERGENPSGKSAFHDGPRCIRTGGFCNSGGGF
jgi:hypothetical protein